MSTLQWAFYFVFLVLGFVLVGLGNAMDCRILNMFGLASVGVALGISLSVLM